MSGKRHSPETLAKMAESHRKRHAERRQLGLKTRMKLSPEHKGKLMEARDRWLKEHARVGAEHPNWRGDNAAYTSLHQWVTRWMPFTGVCQYCGETKRTEHANIDHRYRRDLADWLELCRSCHRLMDNARREEPRKFKPRTHCKKGHPFDEANTYTKPNGHRVCITCRNEGKRRRRAEGRSG